MKASRWFKMITMAVAVGIGLSAFAWSRPGFALRNIYGDHMVFQRDRPIRVAGYGLPLSHVCVAMNGKLVEVEVGRDGEWLAELPAMPAGGPYNLVTYPVDVNGVGAELKDVYVGEVWVCSGQSNMEMPIWGDNPFFRTLDGKQVAAAAYDPMTRLVRIPMDVNPDGPSTEVSRWVQWKPATSAEAVEPFSATGWWFGRNLRKHFGPNVAIALIGSNWGGSRIEPWIPREQFELDKDAGVLTQLEGCKLTPANERLRAARERELLDKEQRAFDEWMAKFAAYDPKATLAATSGWGRVGEDLTKWTHRDRKSLAGLMQPGVAWYRFEFEVPANLAGKPLIFHADYVNDADETYLDGGKIGQTKALSVPKYWEAARDYPFTASAGRHVIAIRAEDHFGTGGIGDKVCVYRWVGETKDVLADFSEGAWDERLEFTVDSTRLGTRPEVPGGRRTDSRGDFSVPTTLWNAMVAPLTVFNIRGMIWYQGCANSWEASAYAGREKQLFEGWRRAFRDAELPCLVTQLSAYYEHRIHDRPPEDTWKKVEPPQDDESPNGSNFAPLRAAQEKMHDYPHTGLACTIDIGDQFDIHPKNKREVGRRLAREALRVAYGQEGYPEAPRFKSLVREGSKLRVTLDAPGKLVTDNGRGRLGEHLVAVSGPDGKWHWGEGEVNGDGTITMWSDAVAEPKRLRYCWSGYPPDANVHRADDGLPLFPFEAEVK